MDNNKLPIPVNSKVLFRFFGEAEYKLKLYEQTMTQQQQQIQALEKELEEFKKEKDTK